MNIIRIFSKRPLVMAPQVDSVKQLERGSNATWYWRMLRCDITRAPLYWGFLNFSQKSRLIMNASCWTQENPEYFQKHLIFYIFSVEKTSTRKHVPWKNLQCMFACCWAVTPPVSPLSIFCRLMHHVKYRRKAAHTYLHCNTEGVIRINFLFLFYTLSANSHIPRFSLII